MTKILVFGDSIVAGRGVFKEKGWVSRLANFFGETDKYDFTVYNLGIPGQTTQTLLDRVDIECKSRISEEDTGQVIIIFAIGINDSKILKLSDKTITSPESFRKNIQNLSKIASKYTRNIFFVGLTRVDEDKAVFDDAYFTNQSIDNFNEIIKNTCEENRAIFIEISDDWQAIDHKNLLSEDSIHPNESGHEKIFKKVLDAINNIALTS